jgi:hypothetical protein
LNQIEHYVLDSPTLLAMGGETNRFPASLMPRRPYTMPVTVAELLRDGVAVGIAGAVHVARPNLMLPDGALVATVGPEAYAGLGVGAMDLNR